MTQPNEAMEAAWHKSESKQSIIDGNNPKPKDIFEDGWNAASEWVYCKTVEDLPKESGEYLVTMHTRSTDEYVTTLRFYGFWNAIKDEEQRLQILRREYWWPVKYGTQWVIAWMPLPPPAKMEE